MPEIKADYGPIERVYTDLPSLNYALGDPYKDRWGLPLYTLYEIYGRPGVGKSSLAYYLSALVRPEGRILLTSLDGLIDVEYVLHTLEVAGFDGIFEVVSDRQKDKRKKRKHLTHAEQCDLMAHELMTKDDVCATILDSISAYIPIMEDDGDLGEAFIGKRAKEISQWVRKTVGRGLMYKRDHDLPAIAVAINHMYQNIGGFGFSTPGGVALEGLSAVRFEIRKGERDFRPDLDDYVAEGYVKKLRQGGEGRKFRVFILAGQGVHPGLTALWDGFVSGVFERGNVVKYEDTSFGYLNKDIISGAAEGNPWTEFIEIMKDHPYERSMLDG